MGFGSYDESEQEQDTDDEDVGEDMTAEIKGASYQGSDTVEDTVDEMLDLL